MLRKQVPEEFATWEDPILGINLYSSEEDLKAGEARLMQNCVYRAGIRMRNGNTRITPTALSSTLRVRGGHRYYVGGDTPIKERLIAYGTHVVRVNDVGFTEILASGLANDFNTFFTTWSITDKVYISNSVNNLHSWDGATFASISGTNIPIPRGPVIPILDRLFAITENGIERTDPRVDNVWSSNSPWATFRPSRVGLFTALHPFTLRGTDTLYPGALAFQANAYYLITGTNFGSDVLSLTPSEGEDSKIELLDTNIGTSSPYSVVTVPGLGIFWFTTDLNVFWVPEGSLKGQYVGDKLRSTGSTVGIESTNKNAIDQVWMTFYDRYLILGVPTGSSTFPNVQFWGDLYELTRADKTTPPAVTWYGPMTGQSIGRVWREDQQGELALRGGEGDPSVGAFVYSMLETGRFQDARGTTDTLITSTYQTYFKDFGVHSREKYIRSCNFELRNVAGAPTLDLLDIDGPIITGVPIEVVPA